MQGQFASRAIRFVRAKRSGDFRKRVYLRKGASIVELKAVQGPKGIPAAIYRL